MRGQSQWGSAHSIVSQLPRSGAMGLLHVITTWHPVPYDLGRLV